MCRKDGLRGLASALATAALAIGLRIQPMRRKKETAKPIEIAA
jgi:hypothetical protein